MIPEAKSPFVNRFVCESYNFGHPIPRLAGDSSGVQAVWSTNTQGGGGYFSLAIIPYSLEVLLH
jgi:hypothetical protein